METALKESNDRILNHNIKSERNEPPAKRQRTVGDFFQFCQFVLKYENYEAMKEEELRLKNNSSPMGSTADSFLSDSNCSSSSAVSPDPKTSTDSDSEGDAESWDLITCYCMKPFAGRPMIECSSCLTWLHLSCAKVKRNAIPEGDFLCKICKDSKASTRRSQRNQLGSRRREIV